MQFESKRRDDCRHGSSQVPSVSPSNSRVGLLLVDLDPLLVGQRVLSVVLVVERRVTLSVESTTEKLVDLRDRNKDQGARKDHTPLPLDGEEQEDLVVDDRDVDDREDANQEPDRRPQEGLVFEPVHAENGLRGVFADKGVKDQDDQEGGEHRTPSTAGVIADVVAEVLVTVDAQIAVEIAPHAATTKVKDVKNLIAMHLVNVTYTAVKFPIAMAPMSKP